MPPIEVRRAALKQVSPPRKGSISERERFGRIVAVRRIELGLSQEDLAMRMGTSRSGVARIEAGETPSPEALQRLLVALNGEPAAPPARAPFVRAPATRRKRTPRASRIGTPLAPTPRKRTTRKPLDKRWLWGALAIVVLVPLLVVLGARAFGGGGESSPQSLEAVTAVPTALAAVEQVQAQAQQAEEARAAKEAAQAAKAREAAAARREAAAARKEEAAAAPVSADEESTDTVSEPYIPPVTSSPPAPSGGGSSGGGSSSPPPELQHGVGGGG